MNYESSGTWIKMYVLKDFDALIYFSVIEPENVAWINVIKGSSKLNFPFRYEKQFESMFPKQSSFLCSMGLFMCLEIFYLAGLTRRYEILVQKVFERKLSCEKNWVSWFKNLDSRILNMRSHDKSLSNTFCNKVSYSPYDTGRITQMRDVLNGVSGIKMVLRLLICSCLQHQF